MHGVQYFLREIWERKKRRHKKYSNPRTSLLIIILKKTPFSTCDKTQTHINIFISNVLIIYVIYLYCISKKKYIFIWERFLSLPCFFNGWNDDLN